MTQKIIKIGTSAGITLSKDILNSQGLTVGDTVNVVADTKKKVTLIKKTISSDKKFEKYSKDFLVHYGDALQSLKDK